MIIHVNGLTNNYDVRNVSSHNSNRSYTIDRLENSSV